MVSELTLFAVQYPDSIVWFVSSGTQDNLMDFTLQCDKPLAKLSPHVESVFVTVIKCTAWQQHLCAAEVSYYGRMAAGRCSAFNGNIFHSPFIIQKCIILAMSIRGGSSQNQLAKHKLMNVHSIIDDCLYGHMVSRIFISVWFSQHLNAPYVICCNKQHKVRSKIYGAMYHCRG